jgi:hypothetical protein
MLNRDFVDLVGAMASPLVHSLDGLTVRTL